ncbi:hypothetical protein MMC09_003445 [Bachmanniomyces sp. S44760]|nr:hypothetical protein [Bachmanniomyces sp. S44760]
MDPSLAPLVVPPRSSRRIKNNRKRRSLPPQSSSVAEWRASRLKTQATSPEVISSLITSLSSITTSAEQQLDQIPNLASTRSAPASPNPETTQLPLILGLEGYVCQQDPGSSLRNGLGMEDVTQVDGRPNGLNLLHPSKSAFAPVVRTSKRPSGLSSNPAQKRTSMVNRLRPGSQTQSSYLPDVVQTMGNISVPPQSPIFPGAEQIRAVGSSRSLRSLQSKHSTDSVRGSESEQRRHKHLFANGHTRSPNFRYASANAYDTPPTSPFLPQNHDHQAENVQPSAQIPIRASSAQVPNLSTPISATNDTASGEVESGKKVPNRQSSLRYSSDSSPMRRKRLSIRLEKDISPAAIGLITREIVDPATAVKKIMDDPGQDDVSKRIEELKELKLRRTRPSELDDRPVSLMERRHSRDENALPAKGLPRPATVFSSSPSPQKYSSGHALRMPAKRAATLPESLHVGHRNLPSSPLNTTTMNGRSPTVPRTVGSSSLPNGNKASVQQCSSRPSSPFARERPNRSVYSQNSHPNTIFSLDPRPSSAQSIDQTVDDYLSAPRLSQKIHVQQTGRQICFSEVGDPLGSAVFCCVGMGLTRYITSFYDELALTLRLRLITLDRPGVGDSEPHADDSDTPLGWPDDVLAVCQHLDISKFSILAHSAGAIYALATALRMPQHIRGRIHLLAPWIPPSQMSVIGSQEESLPTNALPYSQRILRSLPTPFLKVANSNFLSTTSASITTSLPKSPRRADKKSLGRDSSGPSGATSAETISNTRRGSFSAFDESTSGKVDSMMDTRDSPSLVHITGGPRLNAKDRQSEYNTKLTHMTWSLATTNANPAIDLLVCLERRQPIGFRYVDITKSVVIHHGSKDTRVPVENVKWLGKTMRRCEVKILEGEGHGLMASATVMGSVLMEMAKEWDDWNIIIRGKRGGERRAVTAR